MSTPVPVTTPTVGAIPWYKSPQQIGLVTTALSAAIALFPKLGPLIGVSTPAEATVWVQTIFGFIALVAPLVGSVVRARSTLQPLTLTQGNADVHPATLAVKAAAAVPVLVQGVQHVAATLAPLFDVSFAGQTTPLPGDRPVLRPGIKPPP
jgi:hypothetical protein